jgi:hypothetical protein
MFGLGKIIIIIIIIIMMMMMMMTITRISWLDNSKGKKEAVG